eukprot:7753452-Pyramimonas_sp.AAC.1
MRYHCCGSRESSQGGGGYKFSDILQQGSGLAEFCKGDGNGILPHSPLLQPSLRFVLFLRSTGLPRL